nr:cell division topological specificity factor MinE [uncultured Blautia sp.]
MKKQFSSKGRSAGYARERMKVLLVSERIDCSPQMIKMMKSDLIHSLKKYIMIDEEKVTLSISQDPVILHAEIPVRQKKD